jgi:hypothetical protein
MQYRGPLVKGGRHAAGVRGDFTVAISQIPRRACGPSAPFDKGEEWRRFCVRLNNVANQVSIGMRPYSGIWLLLCIGI